MTGRRRVAFVTHSMRLYGASRSLLGLLEGFRARGIDTHVILPGAGPMQQALRARGFDHSIVPFSCWVAHVTDTVDVQARRAAAMRAVPRVVDVLRRFGPHAVWSNSSLFAVGALAAATLDLPHVWHLREVNGEDQPFRYIHGQEAAVALMRRARARIAVSAAVRVAYAALHVGPCHLIYSGIGSASEMAARRAAPWSGGRWRIVLPGRLHPAKDQLVAIEAVGRLAAAGHDVELRIVGDGDAGPCEATVRRLGMQRNVALTGFVLDMDREYRRAHLALSCSRVEAMGRTTAEAMSYGLPVVGCASMGTPELIDPGISGLLCDGSAEGFAAALQSLMERPEWARRIGERARAEAQRRFSDEHCVGASLAVLEQVCGEARDRAPQGGEAPSRPDAGRASDR